LSRLFQTCRNSVDSIDGVHHCQSTGDSAKSYRAAANCDSGVFASVALWEIFEEACGGEVACGDDVGHQNQHLFRDTLWCEDEGAVGERASYEFRLSAVDGVGGSAVTKQLAFGTSRGLTADAVVALAACSVEGDDDLKRMTRRLTSAWALGQAS
jgi:hypothetical protein